LSRKVRYTILIILALTILAGGAVAGLFLILPNYIESEILPEIAHKAGTEISAEVRNIGLSGADVAGLKVGGKEVPGLTIDSIQIDYTLPGLLRKRVKQISISGVTLHLTLQDGRLTVPGTQFPDSPEGQRKDVAASSADLSALLDLGALAVNHGVVIIEADGETIRVPFQLEVSPARDKEKIITADIDMYPQGQLIRCKAQADLAQNKLTLSVKADDLNPRCLSGNAGLGPDFSMQGGVGLEANASLTLSPFVLTSLSTAIDLRNAEVRYKNIRLENGRNDAGAAAPLQIKADQQNGDTWHLTTSSLEIAFQDLFFRVGDLDAEMATANDALTVTGIFAIGLPKFGTAAEKTGLAAERFVDLQGNVNLNRDSKGDWNFKISSSQQDRGKKQLGMPFKDGAISYTLPQFLITGSGAGTEGKLQYEAQVTGISATTPQLKITIPEISLIGDALIAQRDTAEEIASFMIQVAEADIGIAKKTQIRAPLLSVSGKVKSDAEKGIQVGGIAKLVDGSMNETQSEIKLKGVQGVLPIQWPQAGKVQKGNLSVQEVSWQGTDLGAVHATVKQNGAGVVFNGVHENKLAPGLKIDFQGMARLAADNGVASEVAFKVPQYKTAAVIDLGKVYPAVKGFTFDGALKLSGNVTYAHEQLRSSMQLALTGADVVGKDKGAAAIRGIDLNLFFPDLLAFRSAPQQRLSFQEASFGDLSTGEGAIEFQVESPASVLIEKSGITWCDGKIYTQAMRFSPAVKDYDLTIYCDRLSFAKLLAQFGAANAEGKGRVNGRIPVRITNGKISFHDGFLYSTPGEGGLIHMPDTKNLTAGIPMDSPQFSQLDLASEALKDFVYEWAKLDLNTEGEDLLLHMQLDGKPQNPLPFVYRKDTGLFVRVGKDQRGSIFQGIQLDVNFRLPLDKILYYGTSIKKLFEQ